MTSSCGCSKDECKIKKCKLSNKGSGSCPCGKGCLCGTEDSKCRCGSNSPCRMTGKASGKYDKNMAVVMWVIWAMVIIVLLLIFYSLIYKNSIIHNM